MDLRELEAFVAVAEELHFGRAAERLRMSQPPLSSRIKHLERRLRVELFERSTRKVALTAAGERFLPSAMRALRAVEDAQRTAAAIVGGEDGVVRLGFAGVSSHRVLPRLSRAVQERYPAIDLQLYSQAYVHTAEKMIQAGELDIAFARLPTPVDLESRVVAVEQLVCALPEGHRLSIADEVSMSDLSAEPFVSLPSTQGSILQATMESLCVSAGFRPNIAQIAPDSATVLALVAAGVGVTITLSSAADTRDLGIVYRPISQISPSHMFATLIWSRRRLTASARRVLDVAEEVLPTPDLSEFQNNTFIKGIGRE